MEAPLSWDAVGVMHEPIEDGVAEGGIADDVMPVIDGKLAGNECSALSVSVLEHFEQIPGVRSRIEPGARSRR